MKGYIYISIFFMSFFFLTIMLLLQGIVGSYCLLYKGIVLCAQGDKIGSCMASFLRV